MDRHEAFHNAIEYLPRDPWHLRPYVITIFVQALVGWLVRLPIVYFLLTILMTAVNLLVQVDLNCSLLAFVIVFGPIAWSLAAFAFPGGGWFWRRYIGAREPSSREYRAILQSFEVIGEKEFAESRVIFYIYPHPEYFAFARGRVVVYSSGLIRSDYLSAATAHEIAHLKSPDATLVQALDRFVLWGDPQPVFEGMSFLTARNMVLRLVSGRLVLQALKPMWAAHHRQCERRADENVVRYGLGHLLGDMIETWELPREVPNPRIAFNLREYLDPELRIEILMEEEEDEADEPTGTVDDPVQESEEEAKMRRIWEHLEGSGDLREGPGDQIDEVEEPAEAEETVAQQEEPDELGVEEDDGEDPEAVVEPEDFEEEASDAVDEPKDPEADKANLTEQPKSPPREARDPEDRWVDLLIEDDGPLEEPGPLDEEDDSLEEPAGMPDEVRDLDDPHQ